MEQYATGYAAAKELQGLRLAPRHELEMIRCIKGVLLMARYGRLRRSFLMGR